MQELPVSIDDLLASCAGQSGVLIPLLQRIQERYGFVPPASVPEVARFLKMSASEIYGVLTFYAQFRMVPPGRTTVKVCQGTACHVRGGKKILNEVERALDVKAGGTTDDGEYSLETIACFGACSLAPVIVVGSQVYGRMTPARVGKTLRASAEPRVVD